jgi:hypothetical protein
VTSGETSSPLKRKRRRVKQCNGLADTESLWVAIVDSLDMLYQTQPNQTIREQDSNDDSDLSTEVAPEEDIERGRIKSLPDTNQSLLGVYSSVTEHDSPTHFDDTPSLKSCTEVGSLHSSPFRFSNRRRHKMADNGNAAATHIAREDFHQNTRTNKVSSDRLLSADKETPNLNLVTSALPVR